MTKIPRRTDVLEYLRSRRVGDMIHFHGERHGYRVQARDGRYLVCTKPMNIRHTVLYTILDLERWIRGPDNLLFGYGYETQEQCEANLDRLQRGAMDISRRSRVDIQVTRVYSTALVPGRRSIRAA